MFRPERMAGVALRRKRIFLIALILVIPFLYQLFHWSDGPKGTVSQNGPQETEHSILVQRLQNLNERLRDAEFQSSSRSRELVALKAQISSIFARDRRPNISRKNLPRVSNEFVDNNILSVPGIFSFMPHLLSSSDSLKPALHVSKERIGVSLVFGIPTISREQNTYLLDTLASLLDGMSQGDKDDSVIVVFIGETDPTYCQRISSGIQNRFPKDVESGLIEIISPSSAFYPDLENLPLTFGDSKERVKWRTKQNLDFSFLMMYCQRKARFYIQLEDDIVASPSFANTIKTFALQQESNTWLMLEFSSLGFIGKLFRSSDLSFLVQFFLMFHKDKPVDWLLDHYLWVKVCNPEKDQKSCEREKQHLRIRFKPSLFQHVGKESSLKGKKQNLIDKDFKKVPLFQAHLNPKAVAEVSFETYQKFTVDRAYSGQTFFWAYPPDNGDVVRFQFEQPLELEKFRLKSGNADHPGDIIKNATVEALPFDALSRITGKPKPASDASADVKADFIRSQYPVSSYKSVGRFTNGVAEEKVPDRIGKVSELRVRFMGHKGDNWVILSDIHIVPRGKS